MTNSALEDMFASLASEPDLSQLIADREQETIHLEFKKKKSSAGPELHASDTWQWSRALSGFANSDGGIMVWGMGTDAEDRACELAPIVGYREFQGRLKKSLLNATQPVVDNVLIEIVPSASDDNRGYVKCFVPPSLKTPHRAMQSDREYYKRSTEGFYRLEHFDLEDMFGRRPVPHLELSLRLVERGSVGGGGHTEYKGLAIAVLTNSGRGSARAPYLAITVGDPHRIARFGIDGNGSEGLPRRTTGEPNRLVFTSNDVAIHPDVAFEVCAVEISAHVEHNNRIPPRPLHVKYDVGAENARLVTGELTVSGEEIAETLFPKES